MDEIMDFILPIEQSSIIKVIGVGGGGNNAVNHMCRIGIKDVDFVVVNTDAQALMASPVTTKIQIGESLTEGRGAGNKPEIGRQAAIENIDNVINVLSANTKMVFITAGMGGGTGTGAAPIIAKAAKELGILTVAIVTLPFRFEGKTRFDQAILGLEALASNVDSLLVVNNEKLREIYGDLKLSNAFSMADNVLTSAAKGIAEIITVHGHVNVDFADVQTIMSNSGVALMGSATASGEGRALAAITEALNAPLLSNNDITGAGSILLNIISGSEEASMDEISEITDYIAGMVDLDSLTMIWGTGIDEKLGDKLSVTIIATGFESNIIPELYVHRLAEPEKIHLKGANHAPKSGPLYNNHQSKESNPTDFQVVETTSSTLINNPEEPFLLGKPEIKESRIKIMKDSDKNGFRNVKSVANANIDELERQPAYIRNKIKIDTTIHGNKSDVSRMSLFDDEDGNIRLTTDNSFLHDNVD